MLKAPRLTRMGRVMYDAAILRTSSGQVAENMSVCLRLKKSGK
jgi:hypothetical protein